MPFALGRQTVRCLGVEHTGTEDSKGARLKVETAFTKWMHPGAYFGDSLWECLPRVMWFDGWPIGAKVIWPESAMWNIRSVIVRGGRRAANELFKRVRRFASFR